MAWLQRLSIPVGHTSGAYGAIGTRMYVAGSGDTSTRFDEWDQASNTWATKAPGQKWGDRPGCCSIGTKLYVVGGTVNFSNPATLFEWDQFTDTWTTKAPIPSTRYLAAAASIGTKLYVAGGRDFATNLGTATLFEWDQASNTWATKASMPATMQTPTMGAIGTKLYVGEGSSANFFEWDQASNTWATKASPSITIAFGGAMGSTFFGFSGTSSAIWDQASNTWTPSDPLPLSMALVSDCAAVVGTKMEALRSSSGRQLYEWPGGSIILGEVRIQQ